MNTTLEDEVANFSAWLTQRKTQWIQQHSDARSSGSAWLESHSHLQLLELLSIEERFNEVMAFVAEQRSKGG